MRFSAKTEYGLRAILDLAYQRQASPVQLKEISRREKIPIRFLEQVMATLRVAGLVEGVRGARGGYTLARRPEEISLAEVIVALEGPLSVMDCVIEPNVECDAAGECVIRDVWSDVRRALVDTLGSKNLRDLCEQRARREARTGQPDTYHI